VVEFDRAAFALAIEQLRRCGMAATCGENSEIGSSAAAGRLRSKHHRSRHAAGFTLVELLMVIAIIAMLMGMLSVAVWRAFDRAKVAAMLVEMSQLHDAMNAYKEKRVQYPPCMGESDVVSRKVHFMRHVQVAFTNANYGVTSGNFDTLRNSIRTANGFGTGTQAYTFRAADGSATLLDLNTLDQAEALVFWLGGMPTPCKADGSPVAAIKNFGFNKDSDSPFKRDSLAQESANALNFRTEPFFDFRQERLFDNDNDGWLEYLPQASVGNTYTAPFVYFDSDTYNRSTTAPNVSPFNVTNLCGYPRVGEAMGPTLAGEWGMAVPYVDAYDASNKTPIRWKQATSFQIIAAGRDGKYSANPGGDLAAAMRLTVFPSGDTYPKSGGYTSRTASYSNEELDNLTNFNSSTLDESRQIAQ